MDPRIKRIRIRLGKVRLSVFVYCFYKEKILFHLRYHTIAARKEYRGLKKAYTLEPGWIIGSRRGPRGRTIYFHTRSLYELVRSYAHSLASEEVAKQDVEVSIDTAIEIVRDLLAFWPLTDEMRARLTEKLGQLRERFARARSEALVEATDRIERAAGFRDRRKVPNPGVAAARVTAARNRYTVRLSEIIDIVPNLNRLLVIVEQELTRIQRTVLERDFELLRKIKAALPECASDQYFRWIVSSLRQIRDDLQTIRVAPFWNTCRDLERDTGEALNLLFRERVLPMARAQGIAPIISRMIHRIVFKRAQRDLEGIIKEVSIALRDGKMSAQRVAELLGKVTEFSQRAERLTEPSPDLLRKATLQEKLTRAVELFKEEKYTAAKAALKAASAAL